MIERILKTGLHKILREKYVSFKNALIVTNMKSLLFRLKEILYRFCQKAKKSEIFNQWFLEIQERRLNRNTNTQIYKPVTCRTTRFTGSSLPVMTELLSWHPPKVFKIPNMY